MKDEEAEPVNYPKTWEEGKDDLWMVFHISGMDPSLCPAIPQGSICRAY
jgi:hypothetical protein